MTPLEIHKRIIELWEEINSISNTIIQELLAEKPSRKSALKKHKIEKLISKRENLGCFIDDLEKQLSLGV